MNGNEYDLPEWEHPDSYFGFNPEGDFVLAAHHRDSKVLDECNYLSFKEGIEELEAELDPPTTSRHEQTTWVYEFSASHWGVGWVEYLMLRRDAPDKLQAYAYETLAALADYPVLDEMLLSEMEGMEAEERYYNMDAYDQMKVLTDNGISRFAIRRDYSEVATADLIADLNTD